MSGMWEGSHQEEHTLKKLLDPRVQVLPSTKWKRWDMEAILLMSLFTHKKACLDYRL